MELISPESATRISKKITLEESKTCGEIVAVLAAKSGSYRLMPLFIAAFVALIMPLILLYLPRLTEGRFLVWSADRIYLIQLLVFLVTAFVLSWRPLRLYIVPKALKDKWAHAHAMEQFVALDMHTTKNRTGVMIFVSVAEHYVEIIADSAIYEKVSHEFWHEVVSKLTEKIQEKEPELGFIKAIEMSGDVLAKYFPPGELNNNELPNHLIIID